MATVTMYSTAVCPYCVRAEMLLRQRGVKEINKIRIDLDPSQRAIMMERTGRRTVPQIYIGDTHVGGYDDLAALDRQNGLLPLLEEPLAPELPAPPCGLMPVPSGAASLRFASRQKTRGRTRGTPHSPRLTGSPRHHRQGRDSRRTRP